MTHDLHHGIVIHSHMPYKQRCALLDRRLGMIECVFYKQPVMHRVHHGMFLEYGLAEQGSLYQLEQVAILATPARWVTQDILFMHHFFEVLRFFLGYGQHNHQVYDVVMMLYKEMPRD